MNLSEAKDILNVCGYIVERRYVKDGSLYDNRFYEDEVDHYPEYCVSAYASQTDPRSVSIVVVLNISADIGGDELGRIVRAGEEYLRFKVEDSHSTNWLDYAVETMREDVPTYVIGFQGGWIETEDRHIMYKYIKRFIDGLLKGFPDSLGEL